MPSARWGSHGQPNVQGVLPMEVCTAQYVAAQQNPPPLLCQGPFVVKELDSENAVTGQLVIDGWVCGRELGVKGVLSPEGVGLVAGCGDLY